MRAKAATLIEMLVYMGLALLVISVAMALFRSVRHTGASASSSFVLGQDAAISFDKLRRDFQDTSLQSIRVTPARGQAWVSMAGARDGDGNLKISRYGVPDWQSYVCYELLPDTANVGISTLVRYEIAHTFTGHAPLAATAPLPTASKVTPVLNQVLAPGYRLTRGNDGIVALTADPSNPEGGFAVRFVRHSESGPDTFVPTNPNEKTDDQDPGWSRGSTAMVEIQVTLAESNHSTGKVSSIRVPIRVTPRN